MHIKNICTKDPTTCAFGTLAQIIPDTLIVIREQSAFINGMLEHDDVKNDPDYDLLRQLKDKSDQVKYKLMRWSKRLVKEKTKCPQHLKR